MMNIILIGLLVEVHFLQPGLLWWCKYILLMSALPESSALLSTYGSKDIWNKQKIYILAVRNLTVSKLINTFPRCWGCCMLHH